MALYCICQLFVNCHFDGAESLTIVIQDFKKIIEQLKTQNLHPTEALAMEKQSDLGHQQNKVIRLPHSGLITTNMCFITQNTRYGMWKLLVSLSAAEPSRFNNGVTVNYGVIFCSLSSVIMRIYLRQSVTAMERCLHVSDMFYIKNKCCALW